jgi:hypothetical protein
MPGNQLSPALQLAQGYLKRILIVSHKRDSLLERIEPLAIRAAQIQRRRELFSKGFKNKVYIVLADRWVEGHLAQLRAELQKVDNIIAESERKSVVLLFELLKDICPGWKGVGDVLGDLSEGIVDINQLLPRRSLNTKPATRKIREESIAQRVVARRRLA